MKLRGPNRQSLGGVKKQKKAWPRKSKRNIRMEMGKAGIPARRKS